MASEDLTETTEMTSPKRSRPRKSRIIGRRELMRLVSKRLRDDLCNTKDFVSLFKGYTDLRGWRGKEVEDEAPEPNDISRLERLERELKNGQ